MVRVNYVMHSRMMLIRYDGDTVSGTLHNCPADANTDQLDTDGDSEGCCDV